MEIVLFKRRLKRTQKKDPLKEASKKDLKIEPLIKNISQSKPKKTNMLINNNKKKH
jgi:hypothetical protein